MAALFIFPAKDTSTSGKTICSACISRPSAEAMIRGFFATASSTSATVTTTNVTALPAGKYSSTTTDIML